MEINKSENFEFDDIKYLACDLPESVKCYKYAGMYDKEIEAIDFLLGRGITPAMRKRLELEKVIAQGMDEDYAMPYGEALAEFQNRCPEFSAADLDTLILDGRADWRLRNGEIRFQDSFISSAMINSPELFERNPDKSVPRRDPCMDKMMRNGSYSLRHTVRHTVMPSENARRDGSRILVHIPVPVRTEAQNNIVIHGMSEGGYISDAAQRTVSFDTVYRDGMSFFVEYSFDVTQRYVKPDPAEVCDVQPDAFTGEEYPHIRFTPYLRELCAYVVGDESNPLLKARRIYDYITKNVRYSYMREYLFIDNLPEFAALNLRGDCGIQALLFITLCRIAGIGAQWQSGMSIHGKSISSHDWARYYIAPYGWLYADLSRGGGAWQSGNVELHDFSFSNIDPMRIAANTVFQSKFDPPKKYIRIDPYDNQSGEIEYEDCGLRYGEVSFTRELLSTVEL